MIDILQNEKHHWIILKFKISLLSLQLRKFKTNSIYKSLSSGGNKLLGVTNFEWFNQSFDQGFYRYSIATNLQYHFFLRMSNLEISNMTLKQLNIRVRKLGGFSLDIMAFNESNLDYADKILLSSKNGNCLNAYQKILKTYSGHKVQGHK